MTTDTTHLESSLADALPREPGLPHSPLFEGMDAATRAVFLRELEWFTLPGGVTLFEEHEPSDAFYIVIAGCLGVIGRTSAGSDQLIARVGSGETIGELGLLGDRPRVMTVVALRDTSLLRVTRRAFETISARDPRAMLQLIVQFFAWLGWPRRARTDLPAPKTIALIPLDATVRIGDFAHSLSRQLIAQGFTAKIADTGIVETEPSFAALEAAHSLVIYQGEALDSNWTQLCLRRADRILLVGDPTQPPPHDPLPFLDASRHPQWRALDLVLLQPAKRVSPIAAAPWLTAYPVGFHCHISMENEPDLARLTRYITGRAVGLVLSGGGARAYGHIGVIRALREARIPLDLLGGTSMGAIVASGVATGWDDGEMCARIRQAFVDSNPLNDYALPLVALTRGRKVTRLLREHFRDHEMEDLWRPCFVVSSNLTTGASELHRHGPVWWALRASVAIPGLLPPLMRCGEVLVDGAVMNNLPADVMCAMGRGPVIGVDVTRYQTLRGGDGSPTGKSLRRLLHGDENQSPGIVSLLLRSATVGSDAETKLSRAHTDLLFEPPLPDVAIRDWKAFDRAVEAGYRYAVMRLSEADLSHYARI
jgi:NTE family protein